MCLFAVVQYKTQFVVGKTGRKTQSGKIVNNRLFGQGVRLVKFKILPSALVVKVDIFEVETAQMPFQFQCFIICRRCIPVSYTHLDVYKRQRLLCLLQFQKSQTR